MFSSKILCFFALTLSSSLTIVLTTSCNGSRNVERIKSSNSKINLIKYSDSIQQTAKRRCTDDPWLSDEIMKVGYQLGVKTFIGEPELPNKDATYKALHGQLGILTLGTRPMNQLVRCKLITHEYIHVLQHINENLKGMEPLGWPVSSESLNYFGSPQEAEAYTYQDHAELVLKLLLKVRSEKIHEK